MFIKDLDKSSDLDRDERIVVRGGVAGNSVYAVMVGSALLNGASGVSVGSPVVQANPQTQTITPTATDVNSVTNIANVLDSFGTGVLQF
jgi:hypothetical protein